MMRPLEEMEGLQRELAFVSYQQESNPFSVPVCITFEPGPGERQQPETNSPYEIVFPRC